MIRLPSIISLSEEKLGRQQVHLYPGNESCYE
jgi:hypothetical protein